MMYLLQTKHNAQMQHESRYYLSKGTEKHILGKYVYNDFIFNMCNMCVIRKIDVCVDIYTTVLVASFEQRINAPLQIAKNKSCNINALCCLTTV